jgi:hypothetical protein
MTHLGETLGDFGQIKDNEDFEAYNKNDKGYLITFAGAAEAKFIARNIIFQKII